MTLAEILDRMAALDASLEELNPAECEDLARMLEVKVDAYYEVIQEYRAKALKLKAKIEMLQRVKRNAEKTAENLEALMVRHMQLKGFERLPGQLLEASITRSTFVDIGEAVAKPDSVMYQRFPGFVRRQYEWDREALKIALKDPAVSVHESIKLEKRFHLQFTGRKGIE